MNISSVSSNVNPPRFLPSFLNLKNLPLLSLFLTATGERRYYAVEFQTRLMSYKIEVDKSSGNYKDFQNGLTALNAKTEDLYKQWHEQVALQISLRGLENSPRESLYGYDYLKIRDDVLDGPEPLEFSLAPEEREAFETKYALQSAMEKLFSEMYSKEDLVEL